MKSGPIILIEDDYDDKEIFESVIEELQVANKFIFFDNCKEAFSYLLSTPDHPFIIFCDINLPITNGLDFKRMIDANSLLRQKSIPFVFYSTGVDQSSVNQAYTDMTVQGFFQKRNSFELSKQTIKLIVDYWKECRHPNSR